jgi:hypothetical protein
MEISCRRWWRVTAFKIFGFRAQIIDDRIGDNGLAKAGLS